jgi:hypothetical protein
MDRKGFEVMLNILAIGIKPPMNKLKSLKINSLVPEKKSLGTMLFLRLHSEKVAPAVQQRRRLYVSGGRRLRC